MSRSSLAMLIPTRGRPRAAADLLAACESAGTQRATTTIIFGVDSDDETVDEYDTVLRESPVNAALLVTKPGERRGMVSALNQMVAMLTPGSFDALGFMGDDHRPRTAGWDEKLLQALGDRRFAVVYGNDLLQGPNLATAVVMTEDIPRALGYMALPELVHLYVDNVWMDWGRATQLTYLPEVILEHMHPVAGKSPLDEGYAAVNAGDVHDADEVAYNAYRTTRLADDIAKLVERG